MKKYGVATRRLSSHRPENHKPRAGLCAFARTSTPTAPLARSARLARLEAVLFLADQPLSAKQLAELANLRDANTVLAMLDDLRHLLNSDESPFQLEELAGGYQLLTRPQYQPWLQRLRRPTSELRLSPVMLEVLTTIAYKQPITRADLDKIRGSNSSEVIRQLMERGLVRVSGRQKTLGRPPEYGTTRKFLQVFGLRSLNELPMIDRKP